MVRQLKLFKGNEIRRTWDEKREKWYFSVVDVIASLTGSVNPRDYWFKMKIRVKNEDGTQLSTKCRQLKLQSTDGKYYLTDVVYTDKYFRQIKQIN